MLIARLRAIPPLAGGLGLLLATALAWHPGAAGAAVINEFMASNSTTIEDDDGDWSDWIELYNPGPTPIDLTDHYLSDDAGNPLRWRFPAGTVPAGGHLLIWASGKDKVGLDGALHTNFAISAAGEPLLLTAPDGVTRLDEVGPQALATDVSYGRLADGAGSWVVFAAPTPGWSNGEGLQYLPAPAFSQAPGFYTGEVVLALTSDDPQAEIRYTLDGSEPTATSPLYVGPLALQSRVGEPNTISLIPTNHVTTGQYAWRAPRGEVFKINVVRARALRAGHAPSAVTTGSYVIDPNLEGRIPLDVISIAIDPADLFDHETGIYVPGVHYVPGDDWSGNYFQTGDDWERPVSFEFFDKQGTRLLAQDAGARIHGGISRYFPQKSLRLHARSAYGESRFDHPFFPELPFDSYNRILVRNSGNDWGQRGFRDLVLHRIVEHLDFDTQAGRAAIHFLNGEYWGIANLRERLDEHYLARWYGVPTEEAAILANNASVEEGQTSDRLEYLALRTFVSNQNLNDPANLAYVAERMDLENFLDYQIAQIYFGNYDWPGNNIRFWRRTRPAYDPDAPLGHDGRWRWMLFDADHGFFSADYNMLAHATATNGPSWPNPPWSTQMLRGLLQCTWFRHAFINTFADRLNSTFMPARVVALINETADIYAPAIAAWQDRWDITYNWAGSIQSLRNVANNRPAHQRNHIIAHFGLAGTVPVTVDVNDPAMGAVRLNSIVIDHQLPGLPNPAAPYPWTGSYFQGVPVTLTAQPAPAYRFVAWQGLGPDATSRTVTVTPGAAPLTATAVFELDVRPPAPIHAWHFNDLPVGTLTEVPADHSLFGNGVLTYPGTGAGYLDRVDPGTDLGALPDTPAGLGLRARNPASTRELVLTVPSTSHQELLFTYAASRTSNGAQTHSLYAQFAPQDAWFLVAADLPVTETWQLYSHDLADLVGADDNPQLRLKFTFGGSNASGSSGNQRFDNITLTGAQIPGTNLPPRVQRPIALQHGIEQGEPLAFDLAEVFTDPDQDVLAYTATSDLPPFVAATISGTTLTITPLLRGDARITVTAGDGVHAPAVHTFRVLVHPEAAILAAGPFAFTAWDPDLPERTYPEHMLFLQSDVSDPGVAEPLLFPYFIPHDDYHADDQATIGFPYNNTGRTRINGLEQDGIAFVNTGRGRDLGGALLAIDTRTLDHVELRWLGGTVQPNERVYAIRLQYRTTLDGPFSDLLSDGQPIQYLRSDQAGDVQFFGPIDLPANLLGLPYVQLLWRYHHVSGTSGARAQLRLDEIQVEGSGTTSVQPPGTPTVTTLAGNAPNPFNPATVISFAVREGEWGRLEVYNGRGQRVRHLGDYPAGRHAVRWDGTDALGSRCASGVYFYRLTAPSGSQTRKMMLVK